MTIFGHVKLFAAVEASHNTDSTVNGTISLVFHM